MLGRYSPFLLFPSTHVPCQPLFSSASTWTHGIDHLFHNVWSFIWWWCHRIMIYLHIGSTSVPLSIHLHFYQYNFIFYLHQYNFYLTFFNSFSYQNDTMTVMISQSCCLLPLLDQLLYLYRYNFYLTWPEWHCPWWYVNICQYVNMSNLLQSPLSIPLHRFHSLALRLDLNLTGTVAPCQSK